MCTSVYFYKLYNDYEKKLPPYAYNFHIHRTLSERISDNETKNILDVFNLLANLQYKNQTILRLDQ